MVKTLVNVPSDVGVKRTVTVCEFPDVIVNGAVGETIVKSPAAILSDEIF